MTRRVLLVAALLLGALLIGLNATPVGAQDGPPPRPTLPPDTTPPPSAPPSATAEPSAPPSATAEPSAPPSAPPAPPAPGDAAPPVQPGRIVGTVIDLRTGAPTPGVSVAIGNLLVVTDANGNYDSADLPPGAYPVTLVLQPEQGVAAEDTVVVTVTSGARIVRHLGFYSPAPSPSAEPTATPSAEPTPVPSAEPTAAPSAEPTAAPAPPAARVVPLTLPDTAAPQRAAWPLMLAALLALGSGAWLVARRTHLRRR